EGGEQFVEQAEPIRRLDLDKGVSRMRFIFHGDTRGKTEADPVVDRNAAMSAFEERREIEIRIDQRGAESGFDDRLVPLVRHGAETRIANPKNIQHDVVAA